MQNARGRGPPGNHAGPADIADHQTGCERADDPGRMEVFGEKEGAVGGDGSQREFRPSDRWSDRRRADAPLTARPIGRPPPSVHRNSGTTVSGVGRRAAGRSKGGPRSRRQRRRRSTGFRDRPPSTRAARNPSRGTPRLPTPGRCRRSGRRTARRRSSSSRRARRFPSRRPVGRGHDPDECQRQSQWQLAAEAARQSSCIAASNTKEEGRRRRSAPATAAPLEWSAARR